MVEWLACCVHAVSMIGEGKEECRGKDGVWLSPSARCSPCCRHCVGVLYLPLSEDLSHLVLSRLFPALLSTGS